ncbi:MAG: hypothetical protein C5B49_07510 [Bdellovibrio sp.]|nr:MAG: hypothetical protein C5B49_07510 [Bdellovibrio sp.]
MIAFFFVFLCGLVSAKNIGEAAETHHDAIENHKATENHEANENHVATENPEGTNFRKERQQQFLDQQGASKKNVNLSAKCWLASQISTPPPDGLVILTFDDGPHKTATPFILKTLAETIQGQKIPATFFNIARTAQTLMSLSQEVVAAGDLVGNHSWSHPSFHKLKRIDDQKKQIDLADLTLRSVISPERKFFRYPFGNSTCYANNYVHGLGYRIVGWHVDSCDWGFDNIIGQVSNLDSHICEVSIKNRYNFVGHIVDSLVNHRGGILLMHEIHLRTISKLPEIIKELHQRGFQFTNLDDPRFASSLR